MEEQMDEQNELISDDDINEANVHNFFEKILNNRFNDSADPMY